MEFKLSEFEGKGICVFGLRGSGKSVWTRNFLSQYKKHLIVDPMVEYPGFRRYIPQNRAYGKDAINEINTLAEMLVVPKKNNGKAKVDLFAIDESNRYCPNRQPLPHSLLDIMDYQRHWKLTTVHVARRPVQMNTDIVELANYIIIFNLAGKNDQQYLNDVSKGLGDAVLELPKYHYMYVNENREYKQMKPINILKTGKPVKRAVVSIQDEDLKEGGE